MEIRSINGDVLHKSRHKSMKRSVEVALKNGTDLSYANLSYANLTDANLTGADLSYANLTGARLIHTNLTDANLSYANLTGAYLTDAKLSYSDLLDANLSYANLTDANLTGADLSYANLTGARLIYTNLTGADLSGVKGLLNPVEYVKKNFECDDKGIIVYKVFGMHHRSPEHWVIEEGSFIEEVVNPLPTCSCASGVNVATLDWVELNRASRVLEGGCVLDPRIWKCRINWIDLVSVVVPYNTDGKIRAGRVELLEIMEDSDGKNRWVDS